MLDEILHAGLEPRLMRFLLAHLRTVEHDRKTREIFEG